MALRFYAKTYHREEYYFLFTFFNEPFGAFGPKTTCEERPNT